MPAARYLSRITLLDGTEVEIKDAVARAAIQGGTYFLGVTTTAIEDGSTATTITIAGESVDVINGNMVAYGNKEFVYASADGAWHELGDLTNLGLLALKDTASAIYTPTGSISFQGGTVSSTGTYTPAGTISTPAVDVNLADTNIAEFATAGSVVAGTAAQATMPVFTTTYDSTNENLTLGWTAGSFTANTPTSVTLPTSKTTKVLTDATASLHTAPTFTGAEATLSVSGTAAGSATFSGTQAVITVS